VLADGIAGWARAKLDLGWIDQITVKELSEEMAGDAELRVLDVRTHSEWERGHLPGALHVPLQQLRGALDGLDRERPLAVHCQGGYRSAMACSLLEGAGFTSLLNVQGGYDAWTAAGLPTEKALSCGR